MNMFEEGILATLVVVLVIVIYYISGGSLADLLANLS